jgi:hypothetical protein
MQHCRPTAALCPVALCPAIAARSRHVVLSEVGGRLSAVNQPGDAVAAMVARIVPVDDMEVAHRATRAIAR